MGYGRVKQKNLPRLQTFCSAAGGRLKAGHDLASRRIITQFLSYAKSPLIFLFAHVSRRGRQLRPRSMSAAGAVSDRAYGAP
jgi:hypothetical protein